jgi:osmoprotectant transport system substrate-binding protein/osmoprotectant transport system permease protein
MSRRVALGTPLALRLAAGGKTFARLVTSGRRLFGRPIAAGRSLVVPLIAVSGAILVPPMAAVAFGADALPVVRVGSKSFTESYLIGEIVAQVLEQVGEVRVDRRLGLGGTGIAYRAIETGAVDIYPEYTGTLARIILKDPLLGTTDAIRRRLAPLALTASDPLGFSNTYALAVLESTAARLQMRTIGDLARHRELTAGFTSGFLEREDGWPGLRRHYGLELARVRAIEHALAYRAMANGELDVIDIFSTDGQLEQLQLRILEDDRRFFPDYAAVLLARRDFIERYPRSWRALEASLVGQLDDRRMRRLNASVDLEGRSVAHAAAQFLGAAGHGAPSSRVTVRELGTLTLEHLALVAAALAVAVLAGIPLGVLAARFRRLGQIELTTVGMLQTVPALALLVFMIPFLGIGSAPALVALCLYALLPIVRNTYAGMISVDRQLLEIADVLGLGQRRRLLRVELPLSSVGIMAGIKTSAVMTVGTATLAAFIGGGGYGTLIVRGLALNDTGTILAGALPAAAMAAALHGLFELVDRLVIPRGLRQTLGR